MRKLLTMLALSAAIGLAAAGGVMADFTEVVTGDTSAGENQPGWLFNRDASTSTPYEFNNDEASIGNGSLYVMPIGATAADKFIAENFINAPIAEVESISYDFLIGSGGTAADENEFYMNVYANFGESPDDKFYDCRYNIVPSAGSTTDWTTVTFDPTQSYPVATRGGASESPYPCPAVPADMDLLSAGSNIRVFALNVGDTSANDTGLDGYLDNVIVSTTAEVATYDFEAPDTEAPDVEITAPADGAVVSGTVVVRGTVTDDNPWRYYTVVRDSSNAVVAGPGTVYDDESFTDEPLFSWDTTMVDDGVYTIRLEARDEEGNKDGDSTDIITVEVNNLIGPPTEKEDCKNGGWEQYNNPSFKNQGQCMAYLQANYKAEMEAKAQARAEAAAAAKAESDAAKAAKLAEIAERKAAFLASKAR